ncbi:MAG TPA: hypothetical protein VFD01_04740 [Candidatus Dormibacteraeota bacterium]|nr:hypothetical protein [Candidatus Dormibacteraeota bacterium]
MAAFVAGLVISDMAAVLLWLWGRVGGLRRPWLQCGLGTFTGLASLVVGIAFIAARSAALPGLTGG